MYHIHAQRRSKRYNPHDRKRHLLRMAFNENVYVSVFKSVSLIPKSHKIGPIYDFLLLHLSSFLVNMVIGRDDSYYSKRCPSIRPYGRSRQDIHNDITFKVIRGQDQGHRPVKFAKLADFKVYLLLLKYPEYG